MRLQQYLTERHSRGSNLIKLYAKSGEDAYAESVEIIFDVFGYESMDLEIEIDGQNIDFYDKDTTLLAKMRREKDKYVIYTITE